MDDDWRSWKNGKYDNRYHGVKRHSGKRYYKTKSGKNISLGIILGICITIGGLYFYENYKVPISNFTSELKAGSNLTSGLPAGSQGNNKPASTTLTNISNQQNGSGLQTLAQQEEATSNSAQLQARQNAALLGQEEQQRQAAEQAQLKSLTQSNDQKLGAGSTPQPTTQQTTQGTAQQTTQASSQVSDLETLRQFMLNDLNNYRSQAGLSPLALDNEQPTQNWAVQLLSERCIHHISDNGDTPQGRYFEAGLGGFLISENVAGGGTDSGDPTQFISDLDNQMMNNDASSNWGHRENILNPASRYVSIGIAYDSSNMVFVQDFESPLTGGEYIPPSGYTSTPDQKSCW